MPTLRSAGGVLALCLEKWKGEETPAGALVISADKMVPSWVVPAKRAF